MPNWRTGPQHLLDKDTYLSYLRRLDARALLDHYGAENMSEQAGKDGSTEIIHSCLIDRVEPHHSHGDAHPSAAFNVDKKVYCCYAGGWSGDAFHFVMKMEGVEAFADVLPTVGQFLTGAVVEGPTLWAELEKVFAGPAAYTMNLPAYDDSILASFDHPHPYWAQRGISEEAITTLRLGYDPTERRIVFPHFVEGTCVGWQKRVVPGETAPDWPKYRSSPGFPKAETLYGWDRAQASGDNVALVVESPMSVAKAITLGIKNCVATFGAKVSTHQIDLLKTCDRVIVWFDADPAGVHGEKHLLEGLYQHTDTLRIKPTPGEDLGDLQSLDDFCRYTMFKTMPAFVRLGEIDLAKKMR